MQWFRLWVDFASDPKVQRMPEQLQRRLVILFCLRSMSDADVPASDDDIAWSLRITPEQAAETKVVFKERGFIDDNWVLKNWNKRQYASDFSRERVRDYRDKRKRLGLTSNGYTKHKVTVFTRDGNRCVYCSAADNLCIDHALPIEMGGDDSLPNLVTACKRCNSGKAGRTPELARLTWANKVTEAAWNEWMSLRVTVTVAAQNRTDTDTDKKKLKPSREKRESDERFKASHDFIERCCDHAKVPFLWGPAEAKQLSAFLKQAPALDQEAINQLIRNRFRSKEPAGRRPCEWISRLSSYATGPLDRFNKPEEVTNGNQTYPPARGNQPLSAFERRTLNNLSATERALQRERDREQAASNSAGGNPPGSSH